MTCKLIRRREAAAFVALPWIWGGARAQAAAARRPTPAQTEGPFYPVELPKDMDFDLLRNGSMQYTHGRPAWVEGTVSDLQGRPLAGAQVEIWQCDDAGHYHHPGDGNRADRAFQGFGRVAADSEGAWRFRTIRPAPYGARTPHIHFKVRLGARELLTTQLYVEGDPHNARDGLWRSLAEEDRALVTVPFTPSDGEMRARFPIVIAT
jgi:protocatechuate 3,4-dioxygenase beta subunit